MLAARKYRLDFDLGQRLFAERLGGICRSVWNTGLEQRRAYRRRGAFIGYAEQCRQLAGMPGAYLSNGRAAKAGLNKSILDKGWYGLETALRAKARYTGTDIRLVDPRYTSQTCSNPACGTVDRQSRESQADFRCTSCGHVEHADVNAAKNIKARGHAAGLVVSGRGDPPGSVKRQAPCTTVRGAGDAPRTAA
ncbi:zinc ribbon domain-containing protein [Nonomuraea sp. NPDC052116]|uniref:zinc ribbon domain-containing protein n=1 Tax=Nonomuraea sp. NPDC052116 TaxID=3155665 RepID=UPI003431CA4F